MSQAANWSVPLSGPATPTTMADRMDKSLDALLTGHSGASRPTYAEAGTLWFSTATAGKLKWYLYDGTRDDLIMTIDTATGSLIFVDKAATIHAAAAKTILASADEFRIWNSVNSDEAKMTALDLLWQCRVGIGQHYLVDTSKTGAEIPPSTTTGPVFIELTAGLTGTGAFNNGKLSSESVSGSAPLVLATAAVSLASSPMNGQVIDLINTEGRVLRPSTSPGTKQADAQQNVTGNYLQRSIGASGDPIASPINGAFGTDGQVGTSGSALQTTGSNANAFRLTFDASRVARTDTETRMKNVGVKAYMRIK